MQEIIATKRGGHYLINLHVICLIRVILSFTPWLLTVYFRRRKGSWMKSQPRGRREESLKMSLPERRKPFFIVI